MTLERVFERIEEGTAASRQRFLECRSGRALLSGEVTVPVYMGYLRETFHFTRHTSRFLSAAAARFPSKLDAVRRRFIKHALEEFGHDQMALRDFCALGGSADELRASQPLVSTRAMVAFHYYLAEHLDPVGMFGTIYTLESLGRDSAGVAAKALVERAGIPREAVTFLAEHSHLDVAHMRSAEETIRRYVDREDQLEAIIYASKAAFELYVFMFEQIWETYGEEGLVGAAASSPSVRGGAGSGAGGGAGGGAGASFGA